MDKSKQTCPDCQSSPVDRRRFLQTAGAVTLAVAGMPRLVTAADAESRPQPETLVKKLYDSLNETQRKAVCFAWDHKDPNRGLLRTHVSNNWHIVSQVIGSDFYTKDQQELIRAIYEGVYNPEWVAQVDKQLKDDAGGYGKQQNIAIFGNPGEGKFELVMTGRHLTVRVDGNSTDHVAFGGPIFYGHAASGFNEKVGHPNNVYWHQALEANKVFQMLDGKQREKSMVARLPSESAVAFRGADGTFPGLSVADMTADQKEQVQKTLKALLNPYREIERNAAMECLTKQGGLDKCSLAFYREGDLGDDGEWDNWRLEGPSFVWYFRGTPHVHVWVNVADDSKVETNAKG